MSFTKVVWLLEPSQSKCKVRVISSSENQERKLGAVRKVRRQEELEDHRSKTAIDPVCGMTAQPRSAAGSFERKGETYYFCSTHCLEKFRKDRSRSSINPLHR